MNNYLVPFNFQVFHTTEAVWDLSCKRDYIRMFRTTRRGIGEFLRPTSKRPQRVIDKIIERNPYLREMAVAVTVTATDGKRYLTDTYDIWGIHQICIESHLPRAKEFLRRFPAFLEALYNRTIKPPAIDKIKPEVLGYIGVPHNEKKEYRENVFNELGWNEKKFWRECNRAENILGTEIVIPRRIRKDKGTTKYPEQKAQVLALKKANPDWGYKRICSVLGFTTIAEISRVKRWHKEAKNV